mgnify:CR=1 FL=1
MVVKYAQGESKIAQLQSSVDKLEAKLNEREREKEVLLEKLRDVKSETAKQFSSLDGKVCSNRGLLSPLLSGSDS